MALLELPPEILMQIYCNLCHVHEAINLAQTCTAANELFCRPLSRQQILQSIISVTDGANRISTMNLSVLRKLYCSLILENPLHDGTFSSASLSNFLEQFDDLKSNSLVDTVLIKSARYQRKLMENTNLTTIDRKTIIARTLHCYVMVSKIANAFCRKCEEQRDENDMEEFCSRLLEESRSDPIVDTKSISFPFRTILEDLEIMIRQGTPKDWPIILTVLCILFWMTSEIQRDEHEDMQNFLFDLDYPPDALEAPLYALSRMFYIQMTGNHPFRSSWDYKAYAKLVQGDSLATTQFEMLNKSWYIATCAESYEIELDLDGNGHQRVNDSDSFEHKLREGMEGWIDRLHCFCYGPSYLFEAYPPYSSSLELWDLKILETASLAERSTPLGNSHSTLGLDAVSSEEIMK